jgi:hypothetical protein
MQGCFLIGLWERVPVNSGCAWVRCWLLAVVLCFGSAGQGQTNTQMIQSAAWYQRPLGVGVVAKSYQFDNLFGSPQAIYVVEADMNVAGVEIELPYRQNAAKLTVPSFAGTVPGATAAVNGNFFDTAGSVQFLRVNGVNVTSTLPAVADAGGIAISASGDLRALERPGAGWASLAGPDVMATNIPVVKNGARYPFSQEPFYQTDRHPRTMIGVTPSNKLLMVAVDGRISNSAGMTFVEMAETMLALGARNAVNMDGGGSTTMWDRHTPGNGVSNIPSGGSLRAVANSVVLVAPPLQGPGPEFDAQRTFTGNNASPHTPISVALKEGESASISIPFVNRGTTAWTTSNVFLATTEQRNRVSNMYDPGTWVSPSTVGTIASGSVLPGQTGYFPVRILAPDVTKPTSYVESFGLRTAQGVFFGPEQNRVHVTVMPKTDAEVVVESTLPNGQVNTFAYSESPALSNTTSKSSVSNPPVHGMGARFNAAVGSTATFTPDIPSAGSYNVFVTMGAGSNNNALTNYTIMRPQGNITGSVRLTYTDPALVNQWKLLESGVELQAGTGNSIRFTNVDGNNASGRRFVMDAVRFSRLAESGVTDWSIY